MQNFLVGVMIVVVSTLPGVAEAADFGIPLRYTNDNYQTALHDRPVSLHGNQAEGFYGYTESGKYFTQRPVLKASGVKLHRFQIDDAYFYISDRGVLWAATDLEALSKYLALA